MDQSIESMSAAVACVWYRVTVAARQTTSDDDDDEDDDDIVL